MKQMLGVLIATCLFLGGAGQSFAADPAPTTLGDLPSGTGGDGVRVLAPEAVWPNGVPIDRNWPGLADKPVKERLSPDGETIYNVTVPSYQAFLPAPGKGTGAAVVVAPGGGFRQLSIHHEGSRVAQWLAEHGIAAFVLKYRLVESPEGETQEELRRRSMNIPPHVGGEPGVADGIQALRLIRSKAADYGIAKDRIGVVGFSAGGHVAGMMALANKAERPDFAGLIYGWPFFDPMLTFPDAHLPWPEGTPKEPWLRPRPTPAPDALPPLFIAMAQDDFAVGGGFDAFYGALRKAGYAPEVHLYERGNHGFGMKKTGGTTDHWLQEFDWWIEAEGFTKTH